MKVRIDKLDKLFSECKRLLSGGYCARCWLLGLPNPYKGFAGLQNAHFHSRNKHSIRWDADNTAPLCCGCHRYLDGNPLAKVEFFLELLGQERFEKLNERAEKLHPKPDKEALTAYFKERIKKLNEGDE